MRLIAEWSDSRARTSEVRYRLVGDLDHFYVERLEKSRLGEDKWTEVNKVERLGSSAGVHSLLAIGMEALAERLEIAERALRAEVTDIRVATLTREDQLRDIMDTLQVESRGDYQVVVGVDSAGRKHTELIYNGVEPEEAKIVIANKILDVRKTGDLW